MKWRVDLPREYMEEDVGPDIVEASTVRVRGGCLVFLNLGDGGGVNKAYAPGQWVTVERVEEPGMGDITEDG